MHAESSATTSWQGTLAHGSGTTTLASGVAGPLEVSWAHRTERSADTTTTSPEELIAAAHASCFAMAFSHELAEAGATPEHLDVSATVTFELVDGAPTVSRSALTVRGAAAGIDADGFARVAASAKEGCPVSRALKGNVEITLDVALA
jgi:osmotically inducible protein OsmC